MIHTHSKAIKEAEDQSGFTDALERLDKASNGQISALEDILGITAAEKALGIDNSDSDSDDSS